MFCGLLINAQLKPDSVYRDSIYTTDRDSIKGWAYLELAKSKMFSDPSLSQSYTDTAISFNSFSKHPGPIASINYVKGTLAHRNKKNDEAFEYLHLAREAYRSLGNKKQEQATEYRLGSVHLDDGNSTKANYCFNKALQLAESLQDSLLIANSLNALGVIQRRAGDMESAKPYYQRALDIYKAKQNIEGQSTCIMNLAIIAKTLKDYDTAITLYDEALSLKPNNDRLKAYIYGNLSSVYNAKKDFTKSINYAEKALALRRKTSNNTELFNSLISLSINYYKINSLSDARRYIEEAKTYVGENYNSLYQLTKTEADIIGKEGNFKEAFKLLEKSYEYKDSVYHIEKAEQIDKLNIEFETERKESEISRLQLEEELNDTQISNQQKLLGGAVAGISLLTFLLYRLFSQNKRIQSQKNIISNSLNDKEVLLKEIHHRVKNNLQVISSLLSIQSRKTKDETAKEALNESKSRVHSMALIHQNLYKGNNNSGIQVDAYINNLCRDLLHSFGEHSGRVNIDLNIEPLFLDIDTLIPLGLIVNELVTNALKYAFPNDRQGVITVSLAEKDDVLQLNVADNGVGLSDHQSKMGYSGFGHSLIKAFKHKLDCDVNIESDEGTSVTLVIKTYKIVEASV